VRLPLYTEVIGSLWRHVLVHVSADLFLPCREFKTVVVQCVDIDTVSTYYLCVAIFPGPVRPHTILYECGDLCTNGLRAKSYYHPMQIDHLLRVSISTALVVGVPTIPIFSCDYSVSVLSAYVAPSSCPCCLRCLM
jgi:hypothetical protein